MAVYQFKIWGKSFAVDTESGNFFETEKSIAEAIRLLQKHPYKEASRKFAVRYGGRSSNRIFDNLTRLKKDNLLFSVKQPAEIQLKRKITDLTLNIVKGCNLRCRYCWNDGGAYGKAKTGKSMMHEQVAFKAVDLLVGESSGSRDLVVDFYGGEPLLNFSLIKSVIGYCRKIQARKRINFRFLLATNGTLLSREKGEFLIDNGVDIAVSLDGPKKIQDLQRPFRDGKGSFLTVMNNLRSLDPQRRSRIVGRATFTPYSASVIETFKFLRGLGFSRIEVCESEKAGYELQPANRFFFEGDKGRERLKDVYHGLARFYTKQIIDGKLDYENTYFNRFFKQLSRLYHIQSISGSCSAGFCLIAVDMDGSVYPCTAFVGVKQFKIGDVKKGINSRRLDEFLDTKVASADSCSSCWAKRICRGCGSCYNLNYFTSRNAGKPDPYYCDLFRYKTQLMMAMIAEIQEKAPRRLEEVLIPEYYATRGRRSRK